ncbi:hypothetical protein A6B41_02185 [Mannheimia granulomatis]|nr:hypothetical protein A6B41_02185 [Mannheimia granulomatis]
MLDFFSTTLENLKQQEQFRTIPSLIHQGKHIIRYGMSMLNLSSNDYLGLANDDNLRQLFLQKYGENQPLLTASSSRLLTGSFPIYDDLEKLLAQRFQRESALLFNSGYHANIGILPAIATPCTLIVADKLVHASLIDGIRLSGAKFLRYRHNDLSHLEQILHTNHREFERIIIVTESLFSMDGDCSSFLDKILPQGNFHFHQGNAELCPLDGKYHLVASASAVQWFHEKQLFIRHSASQLKANGILLFSTFAEQNLREIKQLTGIGLSYPSLSEWQQWLEQEFEVLHLSQANIILELDSPKAVLQHLKSTGVTATHNTIWTKNTLHNFYHNYLENYSTPSGKVSLTYAPLYCLAKKKERK